MHSESEPFREILIGYFDALQARVATDAGDWTVKGFIDIYQQIYTISLDTKVLSKVLELLMFPVLVEFAREHDYEIVLARQQNQYPDLSLIAADGTKYAVDIKSTYRKGPDEHGNLKVSGMTLGTFRGYFSKRSLASISTFPYEAYKKHFVLGVIYTQVRGLDERKVYDIHQLADIPSVAKDFKFFLHEKYRIAADRPGSGNTRNIGSTQYEERLVNGTGVFALLGLEVFDDYWMNYRTRADALAEGLERQPYRNLIEYKLYKKQGATILDIPDELVQTEAEETDNDLDSE